jgi:hypothetical protein
LIREKARLINLQQNYQFEIVQFKKIEATGKEWINQNVNFTLKQDIFLLKFTVASLWQV